jgi:hypothetical protein
MIRSECCLRLAGVAIIVLVLMFLPACWVVSIEGLDESEWRGSADHDRAFEPALLGAWLMPSPGCMATISITADNGEYVARETSEGEKCTEEDKKLIDYRAKLYKLNGQLFLDVTARSQDVCKLCIPVHWIFRITIEKDLLALAPINSDWLRRGLESKTARLATLDNETNVVTATAKELKDFCRKYADDKEAFILTPTMVLRRK